MPIPSRYGTNYSKYLYGPPSPVDPFPNPRNDAQRIQNARARAEAAGDPIGAGALNPQTGELQDPDRGFGRAVLSKPGIMLPLVIGGGLGLGALMGPASAAAAGGGAGGAASGGAGASGLLPSASIPGLHAAVPGAAGAGTALGGIVPAATGAGVSIVDKIKDALLSPRGIVSLASIVPALAMASRGTPSGTTDSLNQLRQMQAITEARMRRVDPLHQAITQLAFNRLPTSSREGITLNNVPLPG